VLLLVCSVLSGSWVVDALAVAAVFVRYLHAFGMLTSPSLATHGPVRDIGALGTYLVGVALGVTALVTI
jgi:uncharacterized membrane protein YecN with MAPEG domain